MFLCMRACGVFCLLVCLCFCVCVCARAQKCFEENFCCARAHTPENLARAQNKKAQKTHARTHARGQASKQWSFLITTIPVPAKEAAAAEKGLPVVF